jgi:biotin carboxylase
MSRPAFVFVESNITGSGEAFMARALGLGLTPTFLCQDPNRYPFLSGSEEAPFLVVDTADGDALLRACRSIAESQGLAGVFSPTEYFIAAAAQAARELGLPGGDPDAIRVCRDKAHQRAVLDRVNGLNPRYMAVDSVEDAVDHAADMGLPVVVKPTGYSGSAGVRLCASLEEVRAHAWALLSGESGAPKQARLAGASAASPTVLVEEMVEGPEFSVEVFSGQVIGVTQKHLGELPSFIEVGHDFPANLSPEKTDVLAKASSAATGALGLNWGPVHAEFRLASDGPKVMEVNPRLAGDLIPELVLHATGIDMMKQTILLASGQPTDLTPKTNSNAGIRFFLPQRAGRFVGVEGIDAGPDGCILDHKVYPKVGAELALHGDYRDRVGHVIGGAPTLRDLAACLDDVMSAVKVMVG